ncbi:MAG: NAD(P)-dependent oxidoreductase [Anaerobacillus sp.]
MKKVLVTGALGFIGYHLTELLLNQGVEVVAIDGRIERERASEYEMKEMSFLRNSHYKLVNQKLQETSIADLADGCDAVFHLSMPSFLKVGRHSKRVEEEMKNTKKVIQASQGKVLVYLSSLEIYGKRYGSISEKTPLNPVTKVGKFKKQEENLLIDAESESVIKIIRTPLVYGPWQPNQFVFQHYFVHEKLPPLYKIEGEKFHYDALYVEDVCQAMYKASERKDQSETINLSSGREGEWQNGVEWCIGEQLDPRDDKTMQCTISNRESVNKLDFTNLTPIKEGLAKQREHTENMMKLDPTIYRRRSE